MELYFSPEVITPEFQVLNVVNSKEQAVGNLALLFDEKKLYVYGILEEENVGADFKDLVMPYLKGLAKATSNLDMFACLYVGCEKLSLNEEEQHNS